MESIDYVDEYEAEIEKLEDVQTELQNQIAEEVKVNAKLHSNMETQKQALQERHLALEQNVARLQEQLLNEKSSRATLEAGLRLPPETLSDLSSVDEKTKADLDELAMIEVDLANLERKVNEIGMRLNVQLERNGGSMLNFYNQSQQISNHEINLKNKPDTEVAAISESDWSISKDTHFGGAENGNERKLESTPLPNKHSSSSKKSGTRREGSNSTSALAKLTSKLSILKERRSQISNEFQNTNGGKGSELQLPLPSPNKSRGYQFNIALISPKKSRGYELNLALISPNKSRGNEFLPPPSPNRPRGSENHSPPNPEKDRCFGSSPSLTSDEGPGEAIAIIQPSLRRFC
ncbi:Ternary complex factor MIP1, leucine-zipper [Sesbania bispinosa]|nr:Ternary complex factor MIP1, leucine-zipper [Sesbania bispinosa]